MTDGTGHFLIDYSADDFQKTIFSPGINLEWTGGPDLYFRVETISRDGAARRALVTRACADRENVGPCFCVDLCLEKQPPVVDYLPVFDALGGYLYASAVQSAVPGTGLTVGDNRAFYSTVRLNGLLPKTLNGQPLEYQLRVPKHAPRTVTAPGAWTPVTTAQFSATISESSSAMRRRSLATRTRSRPRTPTPPFRAAGPSTPSSGRMDPGPAIQQCLRPRRVLRSQRQHDQRDY